MAVREQYSRTDIIERLDRLEERFDKLEAIIRGGDGEGLRTDLAVLRERLNFATTQIQDLSCQVGELAKKISSLSYEASSHIDFRWVIERVILPFLLPLLSAAIALYALSRVVGG